MTNHHKWLQRQAAIWEEWKETRGSFMGMSMKERDQLLQEYRSKLQTKINPSNKKLLNKVNKTELQDLVKVFNGPINKVKQRSSNTLERMINAIDFLEE